MIENWSFIFTMLAMMGACAFGVGMVLYAISRDYTPKQIAQA